VNNSNLVLKVKNYTQKMWDQIGNTTVEQSNCIEKCNRPNDLRRLTEELDKNKNINNHINYMINMIVLTQL
jgi:hypothetical protein